MSNRKGKLPASKQIKRSLSVGDRVQVLPGKHHDDMTKNAVGSIVSIGTPALEIQFDGMDGTHKWYTDSEVQIVARSKQIDVAKVERSINVINPSRAVIATENPIQRYDEDSKEVVIEVLLMDGIEWRGGRQQIPIVDSHNDRTVRNIFGSVQNCTIDQTTGELIGVPVFASDDESQTIAKRMNEGHITDFSITGQPLETIYVKRGQSYTTNRGVVIDGPALIHTRWQPQNASICATGADEQSTVRRSYTDLNRKVNRMDEALMSQMVALGMPEGMTDPNQCLAWVVGKLSADEADEAAEPDAVPVMNAANPAVVPDPTAEKPVEKMATEDPAMAVARKSEVTNQIKRALETDQKRRTEIQAACTLAKVERAFADELCNELVPLSEARKRIIERMATKPLGTSVDADIRVTESEDDKLHAAMRDGLILRSARSSNFRKPVFDGDNKPAAGSEEFANMKLGRMAETIAERMGAPVRRMAAKDIALVAMGNQATMNRFRVQRDVYHTTGSFPGLLLDASSKSLRAGYEEAEYTWSMWARTGTSVDDMKSINRVLFSAMGMPEMVPEGHDYPESKVGDERSSYKVEKYGSVFSVSWETILNDDLDALSRIPAMQGAACRRKQNQSVYAVLTANAAMVDTGLLFNTTVQTTAGGHANLATVAAAPTIASLNAGYLSMMTKTGTTVNGIAGPVLNLQPSFLIVPAALGATALQLMGSIADPAAGGSNAGNSNTLNIYGPNGQRPIKVIIDPTLDASSATAWYLVAANNQIDTVELTFLAGEESPVLESDWVMINDTWQFKVRQTFAAAPIDYRGVYKNAGV